MARHRVLIIIAVGVAACVVALVFWGKGRRDIVLDGNEPVIRNRRRRPFPFESAAPGFAEYLGSKLGFAESTIRNYRRHLSEFAQYLSQIAKAHGVTSPQRDFV